MSLVFFRHPEPLLKIVEVACWNANSLWIVMGWKLTLKIWERCWPGSILRNSNILAAWCSMLNVHRGSEIGSFCTPFVTPGTWWSVLSRSVCYNSSIWMRNLYQARFRSFLFWTRYLLKAVSYFFETFERSLFIKRSLQRVVLLNRFLEAVFFIESNLCSEMCGTGFFSVPFFIIV